MTTLKTNTILSAALFTALMTAPAIALESNMTSNVTSQGAIVNIQKQGDVPFVSGGVGDEETTALEAMQGKFNLRVMSADRTGHFFGDTRLVVSDSSNNTVLDVTGGPLIYANLPNGNYKVHAMAGGQSKTQDIRISNDKPVRLHFSWKGDSSTYSMNQ